jgi:fructose-specific phosphotransferase system IIC component
MQSLEIALWILIGILFVAALMIVLFVVPALLQAKRTLKEAEQSMKTVNAEILPKVNSILDETGPVLKSTLATITNTVQTAQTIISGIAAISRYIPMILQPVFRTVFGTFFKLGGLFRRNNKGGKNERTR